MGSEKSADHAWDFLSSWFVDIGADFIGLTSPPALGALMVFVGRLGVACSLWCVK
jgi:hypothetical protein